MRARGKHAAPSDEENVPQAPGVGHHGHGENDNAFDGDGDVVDITEDGESRSDDEKENRGGGDACHIRSKIGVLIHRDLSLTSDRAMPEWLRERPVDFLLVLSEGRPPRIVPAAPSTTLYICLLVFAEIGYRILVGDFSEAFWLRT